MKSKQIILSIVLCAILMLDAAHIAAQSLTSEQNKAITGAKQGGIIKLKGFPLKDLPLIDYEKIILPGPQYIISDDPEYIDVLEGIAVREAVLPGAVRLYVYNVNAVVKPKKMDRKIIAVIKNTGNGVMHLQILRCSTQEPSTNYYHIGKQGLADFFASKPAEKVRTAEPGEVIAIDKTLEEKNVKYNELVHGIYEFVIDQPGEVSVVQTDPESTGLEALSRVKGVLPSSHRNAGRGLFGVSNYRIIIQDTIRTEHFPATLIVADGKHDPWVIGWDASTGQSAKLAGNYGVMYHVEMKWLSSDDRGLAMITYNATAGARWCDGMANAMVISAGKFLEGIIQLPSDKLITTGAPEVVLVQLFKPGEKGEVQTIRFTYSPPGASCMPIPIVFIPVQME